MEHQCHNCGHGFTVTCDCQTRPSSGGLGWATVLLIGVFLFGVPLVTAVTKSGDLAARLFALALIAAFVIVCLTILWKIVSWFRQIIFG